MPKQNFPPIAGLLQNERENLGLTQTKNPFQKLKRI
jgi:hypothetical protein